MVRRLTAVKQAGVLNGIEYLEVSDSDAPTEGLRQRTLFVRLLLSAEALDVTNVRIEGGERIRNVGISWATTADALPPEEEPALVAGLTDLDRVLVVRTAGSGDFSSYTLRLVAGAGSDQPPTGFDPLLAEITFSFKVECGSNFDCRETAPCPPEQRPAPVIDYLARDYSSLRRLLLDRMSLLAPQWHERSAADLGIALVELLAYVGDRLTYRQDAIATEAYLGTARHRISLRRHARLVDYQVHEGCSARVFVQVRVTGAVTTLPAGTPVLTRVSGLPPMFARDGTEHRAAVDAGAITFETAEHLVAYPEHNELHFYTWGDRECWLPKGATRATLRGARPELKAGDVLMLAQTMSPTTGERVDADISHRWPVRLTHVMLDEDPSGGLFADDPHENAVPVTNIEWDEADALPFPLCLTATLRAEGDEDAADLEVSTAWGNMIVADHGCTRAGEQLSKVPPPHDFAQTSPESPCSTQSTDRQAPVRFRPTLARGPVTHVVRTSPALIFESATEAPLLAELEARTYGSALTDWLASHGISLCRPATVGGGDGTWSISNGETVLRAVIASGRLLVYGRAMAATAITAAAPRTARPAITLCVADPVSGKCTDEEWLPRPDLLSSADAKEFVIETEDDGTAILRFGDGVHGRRPPSGARFLATYRVGSGFTGNIGAEAIAHVAMVNDRITSVGNPLPAAGGVDPESADQVRRDAPQAFRVQERAVTPADYAAMAERHPQVQRAVATFRWTGSWHTVFVTVDRVGGGEVTEVFEAELRSHLERYRMAGYDIEVDGPIYVALDIGVHICVHPDHFRTAVARDVRRNLTELFRPDNVTFGQPVYLSPIYAAAQTVPGVASVNVHTFARRGHPSRPHLRTGVIAIDRLEIARLDNDPNFPERGVLALTTGGGK
ncbi:putative baseplate assembly protein [Nocardia sp. bgisy134]|uniref:putative baseplate assembly protein n=1 Tax=Nocardia sp. bgisy134 TaxID=3413789 RepID=UPI003D731E04